MNAGTARPEDIYRDVILDHAKNPRRFGTVDGATHAADGINPVCGDKLRVELQIDGDTITAIGFSGTGCAISIASASLMSDALAGASRNDAFEQSTVVHRALANETVDTDLGALAALLAKKK